MEPTATAHDVPDELAVALYEHMVLARTLDERLVALQREGTVTQHASALGEEGAIVGAAAALHDDDWVFPSSREFAAALWRGMPLSAYAHHVHGTSADAGRGRNAPDPPFWKPARVVSVSPLTGNHIPHAVGVAWAARIARKDVAALVFFGDGATSSGEFHTGLNFAGVTRAPVIALCRNDGAALSTPTSKQTASESLAIKAVAYGLRGVQVDGADALAVLRAVREARARASAGEGGTLVEALVPGLAKSDPLERMREHLRARNLWDEGRDARLAAEVNADVERALTEAAASGGPPRESMFDDVFASTPRSSGGAEPQLHQGVDP